MPKIMQDLIKQYVEEVKKIYGSHVRQIILYGSYARGDFRPDSDVQIQPPYSLLSYLPDTTYFPSDSVPAFWSLYLLKSCHWHLQGKDHPDNFHCIRRMHPKWSAAAPHPGVIFQSCSLPSAWMPDFPQAMPQFLMPDCLPKIPVNFWNNSR